MTTSQSQALHSEKHVERQSEDFTFQFLVSNVSLLVRDEIGFDHPRYHSARYDLCNA